MNSKQNLDSSKFCHEQLAKEHWEWVVTWLELVYRDAFIHGYKHGKADAEGKVNCEADCGT